MREYMQAMSFRTQQHANLRAQEEQLHLNAFGACLLTAIPPGAVAFNGPIEHPQLMAIADGWHSWGAWRIQFAGGRFVRAEKIG